MQVMYARRPKESHRDTVSYEIDMLAFCAERLKRAGSEGDKALYLEGFLLHYRNLVRFFSARNSRADDLSMADPIVWANREPSSRVVSAITEPAARLDNAYFDPISKYLQHCTRLRHEQDRFWDVET